MIYLSPQEDMVDTVRVRVYRRIRDIHGLNLSVIRKASKSRNVTLRTISARDAKGREIHFLHTWEASLPKLLFGTNARLIKTQEELDTALKKALSIIEEYAEEDQCQPIFSRVDLVWQFRFNPRTFIIAHHGISHPSFRRKESLYSVKGRYTGLVIEGSKGNLIRIYDKTDKRFKESIPVIRAELQLRGTRLKNLLSAGEPLVELRIRSLYSKYREVMIKFSPKAVPKPSRIDMLLLYAELKGMPLLQYYGEQVEYSTIAKIRRNRKDAIVSELRIDWKRLLPIKFPPPVVEPGEKIIRYRLYFPRIKQTKS